MVRKYRISISQCVVNFLSAKGAGGATAGEVCDEVWSVLGDGVPSSSIYSVLYGRLPGAKGKYRALFERVFSGDQNRYRLLGVHGSKGKK